MVAYLCHHNLNGNVTQKGRLYEIGYPTLQNLHLPRDGPVTQSPYHFIVKLLVVVMILISWLVSVKIMKSQNYMISMSILKMSKQS